MKTLDIDIINTSSRGFSYISTFKKLKLFDSYIFKGKNCNGEVCCQAITEDGTRCKRQANKFLTIDVTEKQLVPSIPQFLRKRIGPRKMEQLKLMGFANSCCFYCWQHAAMYAIEGGTYVSNLAYYTSHPEDLLRIFFKDVNIKKFAGVITYSVMVKNMKSPEQIVKDMYKTYGTTQGTLSSYYWAVFITVFLYDTIKPHVIKYLSGAHLQKTKVFEKMTETAASALIKLSS
jgi:hypothetical protein